MVCSLSFFQKYLHIVSTNVTNAILSVLQSSHFLHKKSYTHTILIPKIKKPKSVSDYRPISLGNVVSRIVSKVLANQLKLIFPNVISDSQSAFVPNRLIIDNTTVVFEILHRMGNKRTGKKGQMAIKLDISKAYNRVEWVFLQKIMLKVGFDEWWVHLAMEMVHIATYLVLINGESKGYITASHGIKQGDPFSPCAKDLSSLTRRPWRGSSCVAPYLVPMECVYPTYYLQMTASFSAKRWWRRVNTYLIFLEDTKLLPVKPSIDKKKYPFSLAVT